MDSTGGKIPFLMCVIEAREIQRGDIICAKWQGSFVPARVLYTVDGIDGLAVHFDVPGGSLSSILMPPDININVARIADCSGSIDGRFDIKVGCEHPANWSWTVSTPSGYLVAWRNGHITAQAAFENAVEWIREQAEPIQAYNERERMERNSRRR